MVKRTPPPKAFGGGDFVKVGIFSPNLREIEKNVYLCPHKIGEVQEWLNWPAWKASKRQKRFRGSNPLLSAKGIYSPMASA